MRGLSAYCFDEIPFLLSVVSGAIVGLIAYFASARYRTAGHRLDVAPAIESGLSGAGILAGLNLAVGAFCPGVLVHLVDKKGNAVSLSELFLKNGTQFQAANVVLHMDALHVLHIFIGGIATALVAAVALGKFCKSN